MIFYNWNIFFGTEVEILQVIFMNTEKLRYTTYCCFGLKTFSSHVLKF